MFSLKSKIMGLATVLMVFAALGSWLGYRALSNDIVERWGQQVAEIQVRYDSARLLSSLEREIGLAKQMASSQAIIQWAQNPDDPSLQEQALEELETYRTNLSDHNYFLALLENRHYYYNNAENEFAGNQFRYVLNPDSADDAWFFQLIEEGRDFHLNVNPDVELGVTKLWIDVLVRDHQGKILGMVGTGLNLDAFLQDIVDIGQDGITTLFVDYNGAIQLYRDRNYIDFASIIKPEGQKNTVDRLFDSPQDKQRILGMLEMLKKRPDTAGAVESGFVRINGSEHLAGVAFLPTIGWFEITLLDLNTLVPGHYLWPLIAVFLVTLVVALGLFHYVIQSRVLRPIASLENAVEQVREGRFELPYLPKPDNEVGRLADHFEKMTDRVRRYTGELEATVAQRTEQLHRQARVDALTGLKNRRGLDEALLEVISRAEREGNRYGLIWLDIDHFKIINDERGHQLGDDVLRRVATWLKASVRPYDVVGRWGGDEFLVLLSPCDPPTLEELAERIRRTTEVESKTTGVGITLSIGAYYGHPSESIDHLLKQADQALYKAKQGGRNRVVVSLGGLETSDTD